MVELTSRSDPGWEPVGGRRDVGGGGCDDGGTGLTSIFTAKGGVRPWSLANGVGICFRITRDNCS